MACYVVAAPAALWLALLLARRRFYSWACFFGSSAMLSTWYVVEIAIASTGINTREYRIIGTPLVLVGTMSLVWMVLDLRRHGTVQFIHTIMERDPLPTACPASGRHLCRSCDFGGTIGHGGIG